MKKVLRENTSTVTEMSTYVCQLSKLRIPFKVSVGRGQDGQLVGSCLISSVFTFLGKLWCLNFDPVCRRLSLNLHQDTGFATRFVRNSVKIKLQPGYCVFSQRVPSDEDAFTATVHLESAITGQVLRTLSETTTVFNDGRRSYTIWERTSEELEQASSEFKPRDPANVLERVFWSNSCDLRFTVVLEILLNATVSKATQTDGLPPDDIRMSCSTASTSVQATLLPCLQSLSEDLAKLMAQDSNLDVEFQCAGQSTKAHSGIVSVRSPVIASMLASDMLEGRTKVVKIPDMEAEIFKKFLRYLYSGSLDELTFHSALRLYEAGDQYAVRGLAKRCSEFLLQQLCVQNACEVLFVADSHSDADFVEAVIGFMVEQKMPTSGRCWLEFCEKHPKLGSVVLTRYCETLSK